MASSAFCEAFFPSRPQPGRSIRTTAMARPLLPMPQIGCNSPRSSDLPSSQSLQRLNPCSIACDANTFLLPPPPPGAGKPPEWLSHVSVPASTALGVHDPHKELVLAKPGMPCRVTCLPRSSPACPVRGARGSICQSDDLLLQVYAPFETIPVSPGLHEPQSWKALRAGRFLCLRITLTSSSSSAFLRRRPYPQTIHSHGTHPGKQQHLSLLLSLPLQAAHTADHPLPCLPRVPSIQASVLTNMVEFFVALQLGGILPELPTGMSCSLEASALIPTFRTQTTVENAIMSHAIMPHASPCLAPEVIDGELRVLLALANALRVKHLCRQGFPRHLRLGHRLLVFWPGPIESHPMCTQHACSYASVSKRVHAITPLAAVGVAAP